MITNAAAPPETASTVNEMSKKEELARRVFRITTSGTAFKSVGAAHMYALVRNAAAGVAILKNITLEEAEQLLLRSVS
jgi:hypothetical protein